MDQRRRLQNGGYEPGIQTIFQNVKGSINRWSVNKKDSLQVNLFKDRIRNSVIRNLPAAVLENLLPAIELVQLGGSEYVYQPEDAIHFLYFPETAVVSEFQILEDGKTIETAMIGNEGILGINSIFKAYAAPNWSQVLIPGKAMRIDARVFRREFANSPELQTALFDFINSYISLLSQRVICINHHSVEERLCSWLLMIQDRCSNDVLPLTHEQIARFLGVQRPSVTLIAQSLREQQVINYSRGKIYVTDKIKLQNRSCDCYLTTGEMWN